MLKINKFIGGLAALAVLIGIGIYFNHSREAAPVPEKASGELAGQSTNRLPVHAQRPRVETDVAGETDSNRPLGVSREKVDEYLRLHNRNAASLLAAFHTLQDTNFLVEAATNFPNDARVQLTALARNIFPEDRRKWLDNFKTSSPSNSLANYLSAQDYFKNNQTSAALQELTEALVKPQFTDFSMETILDGEDLGRFEGNGPLETYTDVMSAVAGDNMPVLANLKSVASSIRDLQQLSEGDQKFVQVTAQLGIGLADRLTSGEGGKLVINQLVGMAAEALVLDSLDKNTSYGFLGEKTPAQVLADFKQVKESFKELNQTVRPTFLTLNESQMTSYWERLKVYGEMDAMRWLAQQNMTTPSSGN